MEKIHKFTRIYTLRIVMIFFIFIILYVILIFDLYILQINKSDYFVGLGNSQYNFAVTISPLRGFIYDRTGEKFLALNKDSISAFIIPKEIEDMPRLKKFLRMHFPKALTRLEANNNSHFIYVKRRLSAAQIELIKSSNILDIKFLNEPSRYYPTESLSPIVGITDIDNNGVMGLELMYNAILSGKPAKYILERDARHDNFYFTQNTVDSGSASNFITTTIDSDLQFLVFEDLKSAVEKFGSKEGSVIILDANSGHILSMATYPIFDPNNCENLDIENSKNRIVADSYELGSVIKVFLALAALEEGVISIDELIDCQNNKIATVNGTTFSTWKAHGIIPFAQVMRGSNNIGVAQVALRLQKKLYDYYTKLGFGKKISILPGENKGSINHPNNWTRASIVSLSFGYEISVNLLQLAQAFTVVSNNGYMVKPTILLDNDVKKSGPMFKQSTIEDIRKIISLNDSDTKLCSKFFKNFNIFGKTGTARLLTDGKYDPNKLIFTYLGLIEKDNYKRIIVTFLKETTQKNPYCSTTAAVMFENIAQTMLINDRMI